MKRPFIRRESEGGNNPLSSAAPSRRRSGRNVHHNPRACGATENTVGVARRRMSQPPSGIRSPYTGARQATEDLPKHSSPRQGGGERGSNLAVAPNASPFSAFSPVLNSTPASGRERTLGWTDGRQRSSNTQRRHRKKKAPPRGRRGLKDRGTMRPASGVSVSALGGAYPLGHTRRASWSGMVPSSMGLASVSGCAAFISSRLSPSPR